VKNDSVKLIILKYYSSDFQNRKAKIMLQFPKDFVWGAATASYQIEGA